MTAACIVRDRFPVDQHNLKVFLVDPELALEVPLALDQHFGTGLKDVRVQFIYVLLAQVGDVVLGQVRGGQDKRQPVLNIVEVGLAHHDAGQRVLRSKNDVFRAGTILRKDHIRGVPILAVGLVGVLSNGVDFDRPAKGVVLQGGLELRFARGKLLDQLIGRDPFRLCRVKWAESLRISLRGRSCALWAEGGVCRIPEARKHRGFCGHRCEDQEG